MCTPKDVLDPSVDGQISYLCGRHDCSLLHFGDPVIGTVYDDRILVSSGQWWPLPRVRPPGGRTRLHMSVLSWHGPLCQGVEKRRVLVPSRHDPLPQRSKKNALREKFSRYYLVPPITHKGGVKLSSIHLYSILNSISEKRPAGEARASPAGGLRGLAV